MAIALLASGCKKKNTDPATPGDSELSKVFYLQKSLIGKDLNTAKQILEADGYTYDENNDTSYAYEKTVKGVEYDVAITFAQGSAVYAAAVNISSNSASSFVADNSEFLSFVNSITALFTLPSSSRVPFQYYKYYTAGGGNYQGDLWADLISVISGTPYEAIEIEWSIDPQSTAKDDSGLYIYKEKDNDGEYEIFILLADNYYYKN